MAVFPDSKEDKCLRVLKALEVAEQDLERAKAAVSALRQEIRYDHLQVALDMGCVRIDYALLKHRIRQM